MKSSRWFLHIICSSMVLATFALPTAVFAMAYSAEEELQQAILASWADQKRSLREDMVETVEKMVGSIPKYKEQLGLRVPALCQCRPDQQQKVHNLGNEALKLLEKLQMRRLDFYAARDNGNQDRCKAVCQAMGTISDRLRAIARTLGELAPVPAISLRDSTLQASRAVQAAHLITVPSTKVHRWLPIGFNPNRIPAEGINGLPESLRSLPGVRILYYPSSTLASRANGTCVTRAIGNAIAIRDAVLSNSLNALTVYNEAKKHNDLNSHEGTASDEAIDMALVLKLENFHCLTLVKQFDGILKENPFTIIASTQHSHPRLRHTVNLYEEDAFQQQIVRSIRSDEDGIAFFSCAVDVESENDHGVLVAIVKQKGSVPTIIYMDCNNEPVLDQSKAAAFIHYLYLRCIA